jgi:predicted Zn-dependent protease
MANRTTKVLLSALLLGGMSGLQASGYRAQILPDMMQHLDCAKSYARRGDYEVAVAHADIVLLNHRVKVYMDKGRTDSDTATLCQQALEGAMTMWQAALSDDVRFETVTSDKEADIVVRFDSDVVSGSGREVGGTVNWSRSVVSDSSGTHGIVKAQIRVRTHCPGSGRMNLEQMRHVACHELGHVLGLGDSPRVGDIMGPLDLRRPVTAIGTEEVDALRAIRDSANEVRRDALQKFLMHLRMV